MVKMYERRKITIREKDTTIQVVNTSVNAVRKRDITKKGVEYLKMVKSVYQVQLVMMKHC